MLPAHIVPHLSHMATTVVYCCPLSRLRFSVLLESTLAAVFQVRDRNNTFSEQVWEFEAANCQSVVLICNLWQCCGSVDVSHPLQCILHSLQWSAAELTQSLLKLCMCHTISWNPWFWTLFLACQARFPQGPWHYYLSPFKIMDKD